MWPQIRHTVTKNHQFQSYHREKKQRWKTKKASTTKYKRRWIENIEEVTVDQIQGGKWNSSTFWRDPSTRNGETLLIMRRELYTTKEDINDTHILEVYRYQHRPRWKRHICNKELPVLRGMEKPSEKYSEDRNDANSIFNDKSKRKNQTSLRQAI